MPDDGNELERIFRNFKRYTGMHPGFPKTLSNQTMRWPIVFPVEMRAFPNTPVVFDNVTINNGVTGPTTDTPSKTNVNVILTSSTAVDENVSISFDMLMDSRF